MTDVAWRWRAGGASTTRSAESSPTLASRLARARLAVGGFTLSAGLWLLTHSYPGVRLDSRIYVGRAIADLSPTTVGQDLMFRHDGQAPFSLYTPLMKTLVAAFGTEASAAALALAATGLWFAAAAALVGRLASGPLRWAMLACLAVLPGEYGGLSIIPFGEALAVPRPFAEAATLAALAAMLDGRRLLALALLGAGALFHPIMVMAGLGAVFLMLAMEDRRWLALVPVGLGAAALAVGLHLPVASRLVQAADRPWLELLRWRNPYLFPSLWPASSWSQAAVQLATVALAAAVLQGRRRRLMIAACVVAAAGVAAAALLGDLFPSVLILQIQPWRTLWLTAALSVLTLPLVATRLRGEGPAARLALAVLALAWLVPQSAAALLLASAALALYGLSRTSRGRSVAEVPVTLAWGAVVLVACARAATAIFAAARLLSALPAGVGGTDGMLLSFGLQGLLVPPLAVWAAGPLSPQMQRRMRRVAPVLGLALLAWAAVRWDRVPLVLRPGPGGRPELQRLIQGRPGAVQWVNGDTQAWTEAGRAFWASELQGASIVFNRDQAMTWEGRMRELIPLGLVPPRILHPFDQDDSAIVIRPKAAALQALCRLPDGPAWVVAPLPDGQAVPALAGVRVWRPARASFLREGRFDWRRVSRYAVIDCAAQAVTPPSAARPRDPPRRG